MAFCLDTSALVKLVVAEAETGALRGWLAERDRGPVSCDLTRTELLQAVRRAVPGRMLRARAVLDTIALLKVSTATFEAAGRLEPDDLRSLDAIHVAAALELGDDLEGFVAYDRRLVRAAEANGITVSPPGQAPDSRSA